MVSIKDISAACGVSVATVSKALNDQKDVGEATKERIKATALKMGYVPNSASRALKTRHSYNLGVLYKEETDSGLTHGFYSKVLDGIKKTAEKEGYDITFVNNSAHLGGRKFSYLERCRYRNFDGVALVCVDFEDPEIKAVLDSDIPSVTLDYSYPGCSSVISDNYGGVRELVLHAHECGHTRIAFIHGTDSYVTSERVRGFKDTCAELGLEIPDGYLVSSPYRDTMAAHLKTAQLLNLPERPTCILYPDDFATIGGLNCMLRAGIKVPDEISVIGYDGLEISRYIDPTLTTYVQDTDRLGSVMARKLIDHIEKGAPDSFEPERIPGYVFHGDSVCLI